MFKFLLCAKNSSSIFLRSFSHQVNKTGLNYGKNGHFDVIIVGGGATGLSLAGSISK